jgi:hypothetical protein
VKAGRDNHTQPLNLIGPQQHAQHCHSQSKPPPRTPHPGPTRTPSTAPKLANGSPAAAAALEGIQQRYGAALLYPPMDILYLRAQKKSSKGLRGAAVPRVENATLLGFLLFLLFAIYLFYLDGILIVLGGQFHRSQRSPQDYRRGTRRTLLLRIPGFTRKGSSP